MDGLLKNYKTKLIFLAIAISIIGGIFSIVQSTATQSFYFGFPGVWLSLSNIESGFPWGININPIQLVGNICIIYLVLLCIVKITIKLFDKFTKNKIK